MSSWLFGKSTRGSKPDDGSSNRTAAAMQKMQTSIETLEKKCAYLDKKIQAEVLAAKKCLPKRKDQARRHLKRKKGYEDMQEKMEGMRNNLEAAMNALEMNQMNMNVLDGLHVGAREMRRQQQQIGDVDQMMAEVEDVMDTANEIGSIVATPLAGGVEVDMDDLDAEMEALEQEDLEDGLLDVPDRQQVDLPSVPSQPLLPSVPQEAPKKSEVDADMDELSSWLEAPM